jgi:hypothetical protein
MINRVGALKVSHNNSLYKMSEYKALKIYDNLKHSMGAFRSKTIAMNIISFYKYFLALIKPPLDLLVALSPHL